MKAILKSWPECWGLPSTNPDLTTAHPPGPDLKELSNAENKYDWDGKGELAILERNEVRSFKERGATIFIVSCALKPLLLPPFSFDDFLFRRLRHSFSNLVS